MIDRILSPALAFLLLIGGTLAVGQELFAPAAATGPAATRIAIVELPRVEVTGHRSPALVPLKLAQSDATSSAGLHLR